MSSWRTVLRCSSGDLDRLTGARCAAPRYGLVIVFENLPVNSIINKQGFDKIVRFIVKMLDNICFFTQTKYFPDELLTSSFVTSTKIVFRMQEPSSVKTF